MTFPYLTSGDIGRADDGPLDALLELARTAVDLTAHDPAFGDWIAHGETPERRAEFLRYAQQPGTSFSTCGLFLRGLLARWLDGLGRPVPPSIAAPYHAPWDSPAYGGAVSDVLDALEGRASMFISREWSQTAIARVDPGAILVVGENRSTHILLVERVHDDYLGVRYDAIEGGLVCPRTGAQRIGRRTHQIDSTGHDRAFRPDGAVASQPRSVQWILNPLALLEAP